jgi:hypothetical protein
VTEIDQLICDSIAGRRPISALYDGRWRLLCPHMLGRNKKNQVRILSYQFGGDSASGVAPREGSGSGEWRCLALEKFSHVSLLDTAWQTDGNSLRPPKCIDRIELAISDQPLHAPQ